LEEAEKENREKSKSRQTDKLIRIEILLGPLNPFHTKIDF
jgi:hypothetical protein